MKRRKLNNRTEACRTVALRSQSKARAEAGNVFFYIILSIALLAGLSYAVSQSVRGNTSALSSERASIYATEIIEYGNTLAQAVSQTRLRGHKATEISLENPVVAGYPNASCTEDECEIFNAAGGGVTYRAPAAEWLDSTQSAETGYGQLNFTGETCTENTGCNSDGLDNEDLVMFVPYIDSAICLAINTKLGVSNPSGDAPLDASCSGTGNGTKFTGTYDEVDAIMDTTGSLRAHTAGCFRHDGTCAALTGSYHYYQVLIER